MVLVLARGHFCAKDLQQHRDLVAFYPKIVVGYAQIVTIMPDPLATCAGLSRRASAPTWTFLADEEGEVRRTLDIAEYTDALTTPRFPTRSCWRPDCGSSGSTTATGSGAGRRRKSSGATCALIGEEIRPDWDLGRPGLREAWQSGDRSQFYPYGSERWWATPPAGEQR